MIDTIGNYILCHRRCHYLISYASKNVHMLIYSYIYLLFIIIYGCCECLPTIIFIIITYYVYLLNYYGTDLSLFLLIWTHLSLIDLNSDFKQLFKFIYVFTIFNHLLLFIYCINVLYRFNQI